MPSASNQKIFVVGCPRSGTTLLQNLLMNLPHSYSMPETFFFFHLAENYYLTPRSQPPFAKLRYPKFITPATARRIINFCLPDKNFNLSRQTQEKIYIQAQKKMLTPKDLFEVVVSAYNPSPHNSIIIEKTPIHIFHLAYIKFLFPTAIIFNIIRDPRNVFASYNKMLAHQNKPTRGVSEFCRLWNKAAEVALEYNLTTFKYEALVDQPLGLLNQALALYGLSISHLANHADLILRPGEDFRSKNKLDLTSHGHNYFDQVLSSKQIAALEYYCHSNMEKFGYQPTGISRDAFFIFYDTCHWQLKRMFIYLKIFLLSLRKLL